MFIDSDTMIFFVSSTYPLAPIAVQITNAAPNAVQITNVALSAYLHNTNAAPSAVQITNVVPSAVPIRYLCSTQCCTDY